MNKCIVGGKATMDMHKPEMGLINNLTFAVCESIVESGGFDNFLDSIDLSVLDECEEGLFANLRKYLKERKGEVA